MYYLKVLVSKGKFSGPEAIKIILCSAQLSMKFFRLTNVKMQTIAFYAYLCLQKAEIFLYFMLVIV